MEDRPEVNQDAAGVRSIIHHLHSLETIAAEIDEDVARGTQNLVRIVAGADGLQLTQDEPAIWHHFRAPSSTSCAVAFRTITTGFRVRI